MVVEAVIAVRLDEGPIIIELVIGQEPARGRWPIGRRDALEIGPMDDGMVLPHSMRPA